MNPRQRTLETLLFGHPDDYATNLSNLSASMREPGFVVRREFRARRKDAFQKAHGVSLGIASFFVKAAVGALKAFPAINAEIQGDDMKKNAVVMASYVYHAAMADGRLPRKALN